jgi:hypothetical protein
MVVVVVVVVVGGGGMIVALLAFDLPPPVLFPPLHPQNSHHCHFPELVLYCYPESHG